MREARIIVPFNVGGVCIAIIREALLSKAGGYTETEGTGAWRGPHDGTIQEAVRIFDVAGLSDADLYEVAGQVLANSKEQIVYTRTGDGEVVITGNGWRPSTR